MAALLPVKRKLFYHLKKKTMKKNIIMGQMLCRSGQRQITGGILISIERTSCRITDANGNVSTVPNCNCMVVLVPEGSTCETIGGLSVMQMQMTDQQQAQST
jgi:hypothetical protein